MEEAFWVASPKGIDTYPPSCCRLERVIYGIKQAHLAWHNRLCEDLQALGLEEIPRAPCVFRLKHCPFVGEEILLIYVDDILFSIIYEEWSPICDGIILKTIKFESRLM